MCGPTHPTQNPASSAVLGCLPSSPSPFRPTAAGAAAGSGHMCKGPADNNSCVLDDKQPDSDDEEALDRRIAEALDCPCVEDLKSGPCGDLFVSTFTCYQKSRAEPKGCDCLDVSLAFADCLRKHPEVLEDLQSDKTGLQLS